MKVNPWEVKPADPSAFRKPSRTVKGEKWRLSRNKALPAAIPGSLSPKSATPCLDSQSEVNIFGDWKIHPSNEYCDLELYNVGSYERMLAPQQL